MESHRSLYAMPLATREASEKAMPEKGMAAAHASTLIKDELLLDGRPLQNLATFVTTYMEEEAEEIMKIGARINWIDMDEYPTSTSIHQRVVDMCGELWHGETGDKGHYTGTCTVGSSEAIMLACLAAKWRWRAWRKSKGLPVDKEPNVIFGSNVQCCWHKAMLYFEMEGREADVSEDNLVLTAERAEPLIDEYTAMVVGILGSTYNGQYENLRDICAMVKKVNATKGWEVPVHVDAASGGFIAPFIQEKLVWDFGLPEVLSINASGHKFGLALAGVGLLLFRDKVSCPDALVTHVNYLGGDQSSLTLNFSKPAGPILALYYNFIRLGKEGYQDIMANGMENAQYLREKLVATGHFRIVDTAEMPLVAWAMSDPAKSGFTLFDLQDHLRARGWTVPAYRCSKGAENLVIMRAVVKQNLSRRMIKLLLADVENAIAFYKAHPASLLHEHNAVFKADSPRLKRQRTEDKDEALLAHSATRAITTKLVSGNESHIEGTASTRGVC